MIIPQHGSTSIHLLPMKPPVDKTKMRLKNEEPVLSSLREEPKAQVDGRESPEPPILELSLLSIKDEKDNVEDGTEEELEGLLVPKGLDKNRNYCGNARASSGPYHRRIELRDSVSSSSSLSDIYPPHNSPPSDCQTNIPTTVLEHEVSIRAERCAEDKEFFDVDLDFEPEDFLKLDSIVDHLFNYSNPLQSPDSVYSSTYSPCGNLGHTPSTSPTMCQSEWQLTDDSVYSTAPSSANSGHTPSTSPLMSQSEWQLTDDSAYSITSSPSAYSIASSGNSGHTPSTSPPMSQSEWQLTDDSAYSTAPSSTNSGHTPSTSPLMSQSEWQLTDDSAYSTASSCSPQTSPPQLEPSQWNFHDHLDFGTPCRTYTELQPSTSTANAEYVLGQFSTNDGLGQYRSSNFLQTDCQSYQPNIPYSSENDGHFQNYQQNPLFVEAAPPSVVRTTASPSMPEVAEKTEKPPMNIPIIISQSEVEPEEQKKKKKTISQRAPARPKQPATLLPSGVAPTKPTRTKHNNKMPSNLDTPYDKILRLTKRERKHIVLRVMCKQSDEEFTAKNQNRQTKLMVALLLSPKPNQLAEVVFCSVERMKHSKMVDLLTCRDQSGHSALYQAAILHPERPEIAGYIGDTYAALGCNVNEVFADGNTLIHILCRLGSHQIQARGKKESVSYEAMLKELLDLKRCGVRLFNPNIRNNDGNTALHIAALYHREHNPTLNIVDILMKRGADASIQNNRGEIPLHIAAKSESCEALYFHKLLEQPGTANIQDERKNTPLHLVACNVNINNIRKMEKVMEQLLTSSANTEIKNDMGRTPIMNIHQDCVETFKALFQTKKQSSK